MADIRWKLEGLPPVEHRVLGLDRRLLWPTVGVLLVVLLWSSIMPAIDQAVDALEIAPGTILPCHNFARTICHYVFESVK